MKCKLIVIVGIKKSSFFEGFFSVSVEGLEYQAQDPVCDHLS